MKKNMLRLLAASPLASGLAFADGAAFDGTAFTSTLTSGVAAAGTVATAIAGVLAGVLVWKKVAKYFNKAG